MKRHNIDFDQQATIVTKGCYRRCRDCFEDIYSEREWETSPCPGKITQGNFDIKDLKL